MAYGLGILRSTYGDPTTARKLREHVRAASEDAVTFKLEYHLGLSQLRHRDAALLRELLEELIATSSEMK